MDDCSSDGGNLVVENNAYINKKVSLIKNKQNYGGHFSSLLGLKYCKGDISIRWWNSDSLVTRFNAHCRILS